MMDLKGARLFALGVTCGVAFFACKRQHPAAKTRSSQQTKATSSAPNLDDLLSKTAAVHATDILPTDGLMRAGSGADIGAEDGFSFSSFRPTLHFALGQLVWGHAAGNWDLKKYAIIVPLSSLNSQLLNLSVDDTFILGDLKIPSNAILIDASGENVRAPGFAASNVVRAEKGTTLREAVEETLAKRGYWVFENRSKGRTHLPLNSIKGDPDVNANSPKFFSQLLASAPHVSFGIATHSLLGDAQITGTMDWALEPASKIYGSGAYKRIHNANIGPSIRVWTAAAKRLDSLVKPIIDVHDSARQVYEREAKKVRAVVTLLSCDEAIRRSGSTFQGMEYDTANLLGKCQSFLANPKSSPLPASLLRPLEEEETGGGVSTGGEIYAKFSGANVSPDIAREFNASFKMKTFADGLNLSQVLFQRLRWPDAASLGETRRVQDSNGMSALVSPDKLETSRKVAESAIKEFANNTCSTPYERALEVASSDVVVARLLTGEVGGDDATVLRKAQEYVKSNSMRLRVPDDARAGTQPDCDHVVFVNPR